MTVFYLFTTCVVVGPFYDVRRSVWPPCAEKFGTRHEPLRPSPAPLRLVNRFLVACPTKSLPRMRDGSGSPQGLTHAFLFEPEAAIESLKKVPTWNEVEQLLGNSYATRAMRPATRPTGQ